MKAVKPSMREQFVTDERGKRIAVMIDMKSYNKILEDLEDYEDIQAYKKAKPGVDAAVAKGDFMTVGDFRSKVEKH